MAQVYQAVASAFDAMQRCQDSIWHERHKERIEWLCKEALPHGSGVNCGVTFDFDKSKATRLVFDLGFHHMDQNGYYDGWSGHTAIVTSSLSHGFDLRITGRDRNGIKDYLSGVLCYALDRDAPMQSAMAA